MTWPRRLCLLGCATSTPEAKYSHPAAVDGYVALADSETVVVDGPDSLRLLPLDKERLSQKIADRIDRRKLANPGAGAARSFEVDLHLTRYERGNAFARAMLAGLGQIHIDGGVAVYALPGHALVSEFALSKTFAWGGIYGAATSMDDIENTFSDGVAAGVTGQQEEPKPNKK